jgi:superfamily II DNA or RNA helicase
MSQTNQIIQPTTKVVPAFELLPYQEEASQLIEAGIKAGRPPILIGAAGTGKTYAVAKAIKNCQDSGMFSSPNKIINILVLGPKAIRVQSSRVFSKAGIKNTHVENYATLRSTLGELFIDWIPTMNHGTLVEDPVWRDADKPDLIWCDEVQCLKNPDSQQTAVLLAAIEAGIIIVSSSATPFVTVAEAKFVCLSLKVCTASTWNEFAKSMCVSGAGPSDISPGSVRRLTEYLEARNLIVRFKNVKWKHRSKNKCTLISFLTDKERADYAKAYDDYLEKLRKIDRESPTGQAELWQVILQQRMRSEDIKAPRLADVGHETFLTTGRQIIIASNFIETLRKAWNQLVKIHKVSPKRICFIVGGQSLQERQLNIDKFQSGAADFCFFTLKAGGVGVSLHHDNPKGRPRHVILPPTWSAIELVQALGRAHRINSMSTTHQEIIWYKDTIEEQVAAKVATRFSCLGEIVGKKENWVNIFNQVSEEDASAKAEGEILTQNTIEVDAEGSEISFAAEALENQSVE